MPVYEYLCPRCNKILEEFFSVLGRVESIKCSCGGSAARIISPIHVSGSHINKMTERVPGQNVSVKVDGFKIVPTPPNERKKYRKGARPAKFKKREPSRLKTVKEY